MHDLSLNDKTNTARLTGFIQNLSVDHLRPGKGRGEIQNVSRFSEVYRGIEDARKTPGPESRSREDMRVKEKEDRQSDEFEKARDEVSLLREDVAVSQSPLGQVNETQQNETASPEGERTTEAAKIIPEGQPSELEPHLKNPARGLSATEEKAAITVSNANLGDQVEADLVSDPSLEDSSASEGAEKPEMNFIKQGEEAGAEAGETLTEDLKPGLADKLFEKQSEIVQGQSTPQSTEKQVSPVDLKPGPTTRTSTSIVENFQSFAPSQSLGAEGGQQGGMSQGGGFSGNPALAHLVHSNTSEGTLAIEKTATDFRTLLQAGRAIPDERAVLRQVAEQLRVWRPGQDEPIRFLLEPKNLGMLQIDVMLQKSGLTAHMVTADPAVKALLEGNQQYLQNALLDQGLKLSQFSVDLGGRDGFMNGDQRAPMFKKALPSKQSEAMNVLLAPSSIRQENSIGLSLYV